MNDDDLHKKRSLPKIGNTDALSAATSVPAAVDVAAIIIVAVGENSRQERKNIRIRVTVFRPPGRNAVRIATTSPHSSNGSYAGR